MPVITKRLLPLLLILTPGVAFALVEKPSHDVTVLSVENLPGLCFSKNGGASCSISGFKVMDLDNCEVLSDDELTTKYDCTDAYRSQYGVPLMRDLIVYMSENTGVSHTHFGMKRVSTVIRSGALEAESFDGIGFYLDEFTYSYGGVPGPGPGNADSFHPEADLAVTGETVTLADGTEGLVVEFALPVKVRYSGSTKSYGAYFRPYADFVADGETYRNWDEVGSDYLVTLSTTFDRSEDVLGN